MTHISTFVKPVALLTVGIGLLLLASGSSFADIVDAQGFSPVQWANSPNSGYVEYSATISGSDQRYLNVVASDNTWVVQNLPVGFEGATSTLTTLIDASLFANGGTYQTTLDVNPLTSAPTFTCGQVFNLGSPLQLMGNDVNGRLANGDGTFSDPGAYPQVQLTFGALFDFAYNTGVPNILQGKNECGPTSAADSVSWLNDKYKLGLNLTTRLIRDILKDKDHMKTNPDSGTTDPNFLAGKDQFVSDPNSGLKVPIVSSFIKGCPGPNCIDNMIAELKAGQDVEMSLLWKKNGKNNGGHWVELVGVIELLGGLDGIWFNDPSSGKTVFSWLQPVGNNWKVLSYGTYNLIDTAVDESPAPEPGTLILAGSSLLVAGRFGRKWRARS